MIPLQCHCFQIAGISITLSLKPENLTTRPRSREVENDKISRLLTTLIVISLMTVTTVILAKFQALLFQSGIGLKIVDLKGLTTTGGMF